VLRCAAGSLAALTVVLLLRAAVAMAYPTDGYEKTGIRRLEWQWEADHGVHHGRKDLPGAQWPSDRILLNMLKEGHDFQLTTDTPKDPELQKGLEDILKRYAFRRYNVAILDITDPAQPRFAGVHETDEMTPGSVAKLLVGAGLMKQLKDRFPDDIGKREQLLKDVKITADDWSVSDPHEVPFIYGDKGEGILYRPVRIGDTFTLWEWLDHTLSESNNSAASLVWRETMLMKLLGPDYPPAKWDDELFKRWDIDQMTDAAFQVVDQPQAEAGLSSDTFNVHLFFTAHANHYIHSKAATATPLALIQWMVRMEQGGIVDEYSSLELKKMLYLTKRRVRYAYAEELNDCGVWFKSGSLYICTPEIRPCPQYQGDVINILNGLVEVETPVVPEPPELFGPPSSLAPAATDSVVTAAAAPAPSGAAVSPAAAPVATPAATPATNPPLTPAKPVPLAPGVAKDGKRHVYFVAVMSNELRRNAAADHAVLASQIHRLLVGK